MIYQGLDLTKAIDTSLGGTIPISISQFPSSNNSSMSSHEFSHRVCPISSPLFDSLRIIRLYSLNDLTIFVSFVIRSFITAILKISTSFVFILFTVTEKSCLFHTFQYIYLNPSLSLSWTLHIQEKKAHTIRTLLSGFQNDNATKCDAKIFQYTHILFYFYFFHSLALRIYALQLALCYTSIITYSNILICNVLRDA